MNDYPLSYQYLLLRPSVSFLSSIPHEFKGAVVV